MALRFLSTKEVSERIGVKNASEYKLPEPDVYMALLKVSYLNNRRLECKPSWSRCWRWKVPQEERLDASEFFSIVLLT